MSKHLKWTSATARSNLLSSHKSIIAYLSSTKLSGSAAALREELGIGDSFDDATSKKYEGLLEKKWTSVVRLQKKVGHYTRRLPTVKLTQPL